MNRNTDFRLAWMLVAVMLATGFFSAGIAAQPKNSAEWLERIARSARELRYTGVFVHQTSDGSVTTRITHMVDGQGNEHEKLEMLDGPQMEVVRRNEEMFCYHPEQKMVRVDRRTSGRFFPSLVTGGSAEIMANYRVKLGAVERISGYDCQWVTLEPKDAMRYKQNLCADVGTGLLLRARLYNARNQLIEQFMFTQLDVTGTTAKQNIRSRFEDKNWPREYSVKQDLKSADTGWQVGNLPAGFRKINEMARQLFGKTQSVAQLVFSDGLLHVSVFIEPFAGPPVPPLSGLSDDGPVSFAIRPIQDHQITVMGEVPVAAVQMIAEGVSRRK